jgi:enoyl-CoA hydratase/carnithine racemase
MDTDELSEETYNAVLVTAEKFNHNLTLQFGVLASVCEDDNDYLQKAKQLIKKWRTDLPGSIDKIFFDVKRPEISSFESVLSALENEIEKVCEIPMHNRRYEF